MNQDTWKALPKIDLHCHLDGSLSLEYVRKWLGAQITLSQLTVEEQCQSLAQYLEKFDLPLRCMQSETGLKEAGYDFLKTAAKENTKYVEVRFAPMLSVQEHLSAARVIQSVLEGLRKGKEDLGVEYQVIVCAMRHHGQEQNMAMLKAAAEFLGEGVCAADLAGDEAAYPMSRFMELFAEAKKLGFPFTIHAGECHSARNVADAIEAGAGRIGHGIAMKGHSELQRLCRQKHIGVELCPISNRQTKAVTDEETYPLREFLDAGLSVTVNTDNRTVSNTSMTKELQFVQKQYGISDEEVQLLMRNAVEASFADDAVKHRLWNMFS